MAARRSDPRAIENPCAVAPGQEDSLALGNIRVSISAFLEFCRSRDSTLLPPLPAGIDAGYFADRFLAAGQRELERIAQNDGWTQIGVALRGQAAPELYVQIHELFAEALASGIATNAFFMHKTPGLRLRLQAALPDADSCTERLAVGARQWQGKGLIVGFAAEAYEPETTLFGGPASMAIVHRLFTADSAFWLEHLGRRSDELPRLLASLLALRQAFAAMDIVDWEDLDVWHKVRAGTGRSISDKSALSPGALEEISAEIVSLWNHPHDLLDRLDDADRTALDVLGSQYWAIMPEWRRTCFSRSRNGPSPRAAAALYTIFFWNRAAISFERQQILAEALAARAVLDAGHERLE